MVRRQMLAQACWRHLEDSPTPSLAQANPQLGKSTSPVLPVVKAAQLFCNQILARGEPDSTMGNPIPDLIKDGLLTGLEGATASAALLAQQHPFPSDKLISAGSLCFAALMSPPNPERSASRLGFLYQLCSPTACNFDALFLLISCAHHFLVNGARKKKPTPTGLCCSQTSEVLI